MHKAFDDADGSKQKVFFTVHSKEDVQMKKSVVSALTAAVLMGAVATPAFAANPFSDVQPTHWAYKAVSELAEVGVIEGYGDYNVDANLSNKFNGGRNITRYEMAQMIAKALARVEGETSPFNVHLVGHQWRYTDDAGRDHVVDGAVKAFNMGAGSITLDELNKLRDLVYEFQGELETLGVRVDDLKDHSDKVQWAGKIEYTYHHLKHRDSDWYDEDNKVTSNGYVFRLEPVAYIDDNCWVATGNDLAPNDDGYRHGHWSARARLDSSGDMSNDSTKNTKLKRVWAQGDYNNFQVKAGRFEFNPPEGGIVFDTVISGGEITYGSKWKATITAGRVGGYDNGDNGWNEAGYLTTAYNDNRLGLGDYEYAIKPGEAGLDAKSNVVAFHVQYAGGGKGLFGGAGYYHVKNQSFQNYFYKKNADTTKASIWALNLGYRFSDMFTLTTAYARNAKADTEKDGFDVLARYGNYNNAAEKGQWAAWVGYSKFGNNVGIGSDQTDDIRTGTKGWHIGASWAPFKNIGVIARYADGKYITGGDKYRKFFGRVEFFF